MELYICVCRNCQYGKRSRGYIIPCISDWEVWYRIPQKVVGDDHLLAIIYVCSCGAPILLVPIIYR